MKMLIPHGFMSKRDTWRRGYTDGWRDASRQDETASPYVSQADNSSWAAGHYAGYDTCLSSKEAVHFIVFGDEGSSIICGFDNQHHKVSADQKAVSCKFCLEKLSRIPC